MTKKRWGTLVIAVSLLLVILAVVLILIPKQSFDGKRALEDVLFQINLGPRTPGSDAHIREVNWIKDSLEQSGWMVELQKGVIQGHEITNVIGTRGSSKPWIILGAHYDCRLVADQDPNLALRSLPVPGANDGASGVAVLLEFARKIPSEYQGQISLVFFDAEDQGDIPGWNWILGSTFFVEQLKGRPDAVVIIDMIGDRDLNIFFDESSDQSLSKTIWDIAEKDGFAKIFISQNKYSMLDDHTPFLEQGIAAVDIIDFDYPYYHTTSDTIDKVSPQSLKTVGQTLLDWINSQK